MRPWRQIDGYRKRLWNPDKKLLSHIWDDGKQQFQDKAFWGGATAGRPSAWRA